MDFGTEFSAAHHTPAETTKRQKTRVRNFDESWGIALAMEVTSENRDNSVNASGCCFDS
jgi:hypothetical protein